MRFLQVDSSYFINVDKISKIEFKKEKIHIYYQEGTGLSSTFTVTDEKYKDLIIRYLENNSQD